MLYTIRMTVGMKNPALFVCDIQTKFEKAIHAWPHVLTTTQKLLSASKILSIPVYYTTQLRDKLGDTVPSLVRADAALNIDKSLFSMCTPELLQTLPPASSVAIVGIESHICVTQTTLDLLQHGHSVFIMADGVSSCHAAEVPIALRRLGSAGATITTSESFIYQVTRDAKVDNFKAIAQLVKESKQSTKEALENMPGCQ